MGSIEIRKEWKGMERNGKEWKERKKEGRKKKGGRETWESGERVRDFD